MAQDVYAFSVTLATGTTSAAPQVTALTLPPCRVTEIEIMVPPGPSGVVGFALGAAGQQVYPYNPGGWIVADDEVIRLPLAGGIESGAWQLIGYNTGFYTHTLNVRLLADRLDAMSATSPGIIPAAQLAPPTLADIAAFTSGGVTS